MRTRRQQKMLRGFTAGLSCCVVLSAVLVYMTVSNTKESEVVVFSEILEGATARPEEHEGEASPEFTHASEQLFETMFSEEMLTFISSENTVPVTTPPESTENTTTTPKPETTTAPTTTAPPTSPTTVKTTTATASETTATTTPFTTSVSTSKTPFTNIGGGEFSYDVDIYLTMLGLVNEARREAGVPELWYSARLHEVCEVRTDEITSYYSHTRPDGRRFSSAYYDLGVNFRFCGENIAYGRNMFETPEEVFEAWMNSPTHRDNILHPDFECAAFGLSILKVGNDTYYYWTQQFALF